MLLGLYVNVAMLACHSIVLACTWPNLLYPHCLAVMLLYKLHMNSVAYADDCT